MHYYLKKVPPCRGGGRMGADPTIGAWETGSDAARRGKHCRRRVEHGRAAEGRQREREGGTPRGERRRTELPEAARENGPILHLSKMGHDGDQGRHGQQPEHACVKCGTVST